MSYFSGKFLKAVRRIRHRMDERHIHNFRLGVKRLRALWAFREWVTGKRVSGQDRKLIQKAFKRSGTLRDIQVRQEILEDDLQPLMGHETANHADSKKAGKRFRETIRQKRLSPRHLASRIRKWTSFADRMSDEKLVINGESFYLRGMERLHQLAAQLPDDRVLHQIRKEIKHLIYIGQFLEEALPGHTPWQDRLPVLINVAALIGEWHDLHLLPSHLASDDPSRQTTDDLLEQARTKAMQGIHQLLG